MEITFLGTGTSHGVPVIGCRCEVCLSPNPKNRRNRTGVWLHDDKQSAIIDVSSEFRIAALQYGLQKLDFTLLTHGHSDHISGLDDLRIFSQTSGKAMPLYSNTQTLKEVKERFAYAFEAPKEYGGGVPQYDLIEINSPLKIGDWEITPLPIMHGPWPIYGFRINNFAFITDVTLIPKSTLALLNNLDYLVLDCLRHRPHSTHLCLPQAIEYAQIIKAKETYFTHFTHELEHEETQKLLPPSVYMSYDGLTLNTR